MSATEQEVPDVVLQVESEQSQQQPQESQPQSESQLTPQESPALAEVTPVSAVEAPVEVPAGTPVLEEASKIEPVAEVVQAAAAPEPAVVEAQVEEKPAVVEEKPVEEPQVEKAAVPEVNKVEEKAPEVKVEEKAVTAAAATPTPAPAPTTSVVAASQKWSSDFTTRAPAPISLTTSTNTPPAKTTAAPSTATTATASTNSSPAISRTPSATTPSSINARAAAWNNNQNLQAPKTTDFSRPPTVNVTTPVTRSNATFSYSNTPLNQTQMQTNAFDKRSAGTSQGSLASLMGSSLSPAGVQHKGQFTGLVKARVDPEEERARQELMKNKQTNSSLQTAMRQSICIANDISAGKRQSVVPSEQFLAKKLDNNNLFARAKATQGTNADGTAVVGEWIEPATSR